MDKYDLSALTTTYSPTSPLDEENNVQQPKPTDIVPVSGNYEWNDPELIRSELLPVKPFTIDMIPEPIQEFVADESHRMQVSMDFIAIPLIVVISSIIGAGCAIRPKKHDSWTVIPNLWGGVIADPGKLKTPAIAASVSLLDPLENQAEEEYQSKKRTYDADKQVFEANQAAIKHDMRKSASPNTTSSRQRDKGVHTGTSLDMDTLKQKYAELEEPAAPIRRRYKTNDSTIEKYVDDLNENPRGTLLYRDELTGLFTAWDRAGHEQDRAFYLEAWNGTGSFTVSRVSRGHIHAKNMCVSILGSIQPQKIKSYLYQSIKGNDNDGLLQRFQLLVYPDKLDYWTMVDERPDEEAIKKVQLIINALAYQNFDSLAGIRTEEGLKQPYFRFSEEAQNLFYQWIKQLETIKLEADDHPVMLEHLSKYRKLVPGLALIFHLIEIMDGRSNGPVSARSLERAIAFADYLESHARRIYGLATSVHNEVAHALSEKILAGKLGNQFNPRDVYRKGWTYLQSKELVKAACDELVEAFWLRKDYQEVNGKTVVSYIVNPKVHSKFKKKEKLVKSSIQAN